MAIISSEQRGDSPTADTSAGTSTTARPDNLEFTRDLIFSAGGDGRLLFASRGWLDALDYGPPDLQTLTAFDVIHPDSVPLYNQMAQRALLGEPGGPVEFLFMSRDGRQLLLEGTLERVDGPGDQVAIIGIFHHKYRPAQPAELLPASERQFRTAFENALQGMALVSPSGVYLQVNSALCNILGYSEQDFPGMRFQDTIYPGDALKIDNQIRTSLAQGVDSLQIETQLVDKLGHEVWVLLSVSIVRDAAGAPVYLVVQVWDNSAQRAAEEALRASEENYRKERDFNAAILDAAGTLLVVVDATGEVSRFNRACEEVSGYPRELVEGRSFWEVLGWGDQAIAQRLKETFESRGMKVLPNAWEDYWVVRDGSRRLISWSLSVMPGDDTRPEFIIANGVDVTRQRAQEEELRLSEERFRRAFEDAAIGMALVAPDGRWLRVNRALCDIVGYSEEELLKTDFQSITHPDDLEADLAHARHLLDGEIDNFQFEKRYIHKRGALIRALISVSLVRDGKGEPLYFIAEIQDITARKRAEEAQRLLIEAGAVLAGSIDYSTTLGNVARLMVRSLADYCIIDFVEDDGQIRRIAGAHKDPARQLLVDELVTFSPTPHRKTAVTQVISAREPMLLVDITRDIIEASAVSPRHAQLVRELNAHSCIIVPLESQEGVIGAMSLLLCEPGRKYSGTDLSLATDVARRAASALENATLYQQAREALASRDAFLSIVSHDIRNSLIAIGAFASALPDFVRQPDTTDGRTLLEGLAQIRGGVEQANHLVHDLMDFVLLQAGKPLDLARKPVDLVALTRQVIAQQQQTTTRHTIVLKTSEQEVAGSWDEERLARVIVNLLSNAIKYSPRGGEVLVSVEQQEDDKGEWAVVSVHDQGVGIPQEDLPYIFDRFSRARNALHIKGSGLGLFSARQIVQLHGGSIFAESEEGAGSSFTVRLPLNAE